jgi:hypothetical protein
VLRDERAKKPRLTRSPTHAGRTLPHFLVLSICFGH